MNCCFDPEPCKPNPIQEISELFASPSVRKLIHSITSMDDTSSYSFNVDDIKGLNYKKIADDLSYKHPFALVQVYGKKDICLAVIHHTVADKLKRSCPTQYRLVNPPHRAITNNKPVRIRLDEISQIANDIKDIKKSNWFSNRQKNLNNTNATPLIVNVTNINTN